MRSYGSLVKNLNHKNAKIKKAAQGLHRTWHFIRLSLSPLSTLLKISLRTSPTPGSSSKAAQPRASSCGRRADAHPLPRTCTAQLDPGWPAAPCLCKQEIVVRFLPEQRGKTCGAAKHIEGFNTSCFCPLCIEHAAWPCLIEKAAKPREREEKMGKTLLLVPYQDLPVP